MKPAFFGFLVLFGALFLPDSARGAAFRRFGSDDGLPNSYVLSIHQDSRGMLWLGTMSGLCRYDGYKFTPALDRRSGQPFSQRVIRIHEDSRGDMWLESFDGAIYRYDRSCNMIAERFPAEEQDAEPGMRGNTLFHRGAGNSKYMSFDNFGLIRVDGEGCSQFCPYGGRTTATANLVCHFILETSGDAVWLGTSAGLMLYNPADNTLQPVLRGGDYTYCVRHSDRELLLVSRDRGLCRFDLQTLTTAPVEHFPEAVRDEITFLERTPAGAVWLATASGFYWLGAEGRWVGVPIADRITGAIISPHIDSRGRIWFVTSRSDAIYCYDPQAGALKNYPVNLSRSRMHDYMTVAYYFEDSHGDMWVGTLVDGLCRIDPGTGTFQLYANNIYDPTTISANGQLSIFEDSSGFLWIGTRKGGLCKMNLDDKKFEHLIPNPNSVEEFHNEVNSIVRDADGRMWISIYGGDVYVLENDRLTKTEIRFGKGNFDPERLWVYQIYNDSVGNIWFATNKRGLYRAVLRKTGARLVVTLDDVPHEDLRKNGRGIDIYTLLEDHRGRLWVGTYGDGLYYIDLACKPYKLQTFNGLNGAEPSFKRVRCVFEDSRRRLWVVGVGGVCLYESDAEGGMPHLVRHFKNVLLQPYSLPHNDVNVVFEDSAGSVWLGTNGGGLCRYREAENDFQRFTTAEGLSSQVVFAVEEDAARNLWVFTDSGLSKRTPGGRFVTYTTEDGLFNSNFAECRPYKDARGVIYMGTVQGMIWFDPSQIVENTSFPRILFTDFLISNKSILPGKGSPLAKDINETERITLKHTQKDVGFEFTSDLYSEPNKRIFAYMLEGYETEWNYTVNQHKVTYTNLAPGHYTFRVRSANHQGEWDSASRDIGLVIRKSPFLANFALLVYAGMLLTIGVLLYRYLRQYYSLKSRLAFEKKVTNIKLRFFTNISHELRTLLTLIQAPLSALKEDRIAPDARPLIDTIRRNTDLLYNLVEEILDFKKIQNNKMSLRVTEGDVVAFFLQISDLFIVTARNKGIDYTIECHDTEHGGWFDVEKVEKILTNLLSNAVKYTPEGRTIRVSLRFAEASMQLEVADTGIGFDARDSRLFERYYQAEGVYSSHGTGIGLSLVKEFTRLHHGVLDYNSCPGHGSRFRVTLPICREAYSEAEIAREVSWTLGACAEMVVDKIVHSPCAEPVARDDAQRDLVLVVEDNRDLREFLTDSFSKYYRVESAADGLEGLAKANDLLPDVIITDVVMPRMTGIEMVGKLRAKFETNHLLVVMLSAKNTLQDRLDGITTGADDYIEKPFNFNYLLLRISNLIEQRKLLRLRFAESQHDVAAELGRNPLDESFLKQVDAIVLGHMSDSDFGLEKLCRELMQSKTPVFKRIKQITGCSPNQYIKMVRLRAASDMLRQGGCSVADACFAVGYTDINYFRTQFKSFFGVSPGQCKKA